MAVISIIICCTSAKVCYGEVVGSGKRYQGSTFHQGRAMSSSGPCESLISSSGRSGSGPQHFPWKESVPNIGEIYGGVSAPNIV